MSHDSGRDERLAAAEALLAQFFERQGAGESVRFADFIRSHPDYEAELRELAAALDDPDATPGDARGEPGQEASRLARALEELASTPLPDGRYAVEGEVGKGGMGVVFRVRDTKLDRPLAMKVIVGQATAARTGRTPPVESRRLARFVNEAKLTSQLDHPGIVPVHEVGVDAEGRAFFTMKLVRGITLREAFERRAAGDPKWTTAAVLSVIERVCEAVAFAHERGVIHRDLKPDNVMVGDFGEVYVMDWGLARRLADRETPGTNAAVDEELGAHVSMTRDGAVVGTPAYMSPEQARGEISSMGPPSDVCSIGAMLYQLIGGSPPYVRRGERPSAAAVLARIVSGPPPRLPARAAPPELIAICERSMAPEPSERYATVSELAQDLNRFVSGRTVRAFEAGTWAETKKWVRRNKALAGAIAAVLVVSTGGAIAFQLKAAEAEENAIAEQANAARAARSETAAQESAAVAQRNAEAAQQARDEATRKANDVLSLSSQKDLDDLVAEAETLWPAHPEMIERYESWLARARELIDGRPEAPGQKRRPSLAEHKATLAELRREAKPLTEEQIRADRESHPKYAELQAKQAELLWQSRMLGLEPWPSEAEVEAALANEPLPPDADALNALAWPLVDPAKPVYGQEVRAVLLARRAVAVAAEEKQAGIRDTLAWSLYRVGRFDDALAEMRTAMSEPGGDAVKTSAAGLEKSVASWSESEIAKCRTARDELSHEVATLTSAVSERRTFEFEDVEKAWWDRALSKLVGDLETLRDPNAGLMNDVLAEPFGWGIAKRYKFAKTIKELSVDGPEAKQLWTDAITAIRASPKYDGLLIEPQIGLLPIGVDPASQLWEFAHLQTGNRAVRGADGRLVLTEETGLVLVLIPGGKFWMGAQNKPGASNHDPQAFYYEGPVHEVDLSAYFLSKYEMTQGQWRSITGTNPSYYRSTHPAFSPLHPVESVSWWMCFDVMERLHLSLPSEAQWERGARGGTATAWWTGQERESLRGTVNLADQTAKRGGATWSSINDWLDLEDGSAVHCAVGKYAANNFGLHEVAGNLLELCLDGGDPDFYGAPTDKDPVSPWAGSAERVCRGGSYANQALYARSAHRHFTTADVSSGSIGLRPSRALDR